MKTKTALTKTYQQVVQAFPLPPKKKKKEKKTKTEGLSACLSYQQLPFIKPNWYTLAISIDACKEKQFHMDDGSL